LDGSEFTEATFAAFDRAQQRRRQCQCLPAESLVESCSTPDEKRSTRRPQNRELPVIKIEPRSASRHASLSHLMEYLEGFARGALFRVPAPENSRISLQGAVYQATLFGTLRGNEVKSAFASATDCGWRENRQSRLGRCLRRQKQRVESSAKARGEHF
jgi:hypothetical protein